MPSPPHYTLQKNCLHFSICVCHPCDGAMLIFPVSFRFNGCSPKGIRRKHRRIEKRNSIAKVHKSKSDKRTSTNKYRKRHQDHTHEPKIGPKEAENDPRSAPNGAKRGRRGTKKRSPTASRTKNRTKTSTRPTWTRQGGDSPTFPSPPGVYLRAPNVP